MVPWVIRLSEADGVSSPPQKCHWSEDVMLSQQQRRSIWGKALNPSPPLPRPFTVFILSNAEGFRVTIERPWLVRLSM